MADLLAFNRHDIDEVISSGRTPGYASRIYLTTGDQLNSNRSNMLLRIVEEPIRRGHLDGGAHLLKYDHAFTALLGPRSRAPGTTSSLTELAFRLDAEGVMWLMRDCWWPS